MTTIYTSTFEANALYIAEKLHDSEIDFLLKQVTSDSMVVYTIEIDAAYIEKANHLLQEINLDETEVHPESEGFLNGHIEWTQNMYNPGYYTGGKIPHYLYNKDVWKYLIPIFSISIIFPIVMIIIFQATFDLETMLMIGVYLFVVISMIWQLRKRKK
ncbi:hypothetical protein ACG2LH_00800 [Zhouia sp. PK063]|uniref:hypothetical protein n=1 Tax=Zhouia sp. PK063 TaxID=3373602 RepID=UPI00378E3CB7